MYDFSKIDRLKQKLNDYRPLTQEQVAQIEREKKIEHVWSSNALEGNSLTKYETASILEVGLTANGSPVKDVLETLDLGKAYNFMEELATGNQELSEEVIQKINQLVTIKSVDNIDFAGVYRLVNAYPYRVEGVKYAEPIYIRQEMGNLIYWHDEIAKSLHPVEYAALLHLKFVSIHPFADGNGRTARLLMAFALVRNGFPIVNIQPEANSRSEYMEALANSQRQDNPEPFVNLVIKYVEKELESRISILELNESNLNHFGKAIEHDLDDELEL
ncbi:Fic family protein [Pseudolactococcus yaeyamensis]